MTDRQPIYCAVCDIGAGVGFWKTQCPRCTPGWLLDLMADPEAWHERREFTINHAARERVEHNDG